MKKYPVSLLFFFLSIVCAFAQTSSISGLVSDAANGEEISYATVALFSDTSAASKPIKGALTNKYGYYAINNVAKGKYYLRCKIVGYTAQINVIEVTGAQDLKANFKLKVAEVLTKEINVVAEKETDFIPTISSVVIKPNFIQRLPSISGETDIFRALQLLPGVKSSSELSAGLYIRGGSPDQNLILLDGVTVYNPSHLGGFLSAFNSDAIRDIKLIKGGFPAEYGGRLSSVIDMTMKEGNKERFEASGGISLVSARLSLEAPIDQNSSFFISGRRMYLDAVTTLFGVKDAPTYYFYDFNAKTNYKISDNDRIFVSGYFCRDVLKPSKEDEGDFSIDWGNTTGNLRWTHIVSPELFTNFSLIYSDYTFNTNIGSNDKSYNFNTKSGITDFTLRGEAQYAYDDANSIKSGIEITRHNFLSKASNEVIDIDVPTSELNINSIEAALYLQDEWRISSDWLANIGARGVYFESGAFFALEPRLQLTYFMKNDWTMKASFSTANQYLHLISRADLSLPTDLWFPTTSSVKPSKAWQAILGLEKTLNQGEWLLSAEIYYKGMTNLYEYKDDADFSIGAPLESQFTSGSGKAYGLELFINKRIGSFTGWIGYTLSWTTRLFSALNGGKEFYPRYDKRHDISVVGAYKLSESWDLGATWTYSSGQGFTAPTGVYSCGDIYYDYSQRNGFRLPPFHKLDLNLTDNFSWFGIPWQFSINIYNVYNRRNPFMWYISSDYVYNPTTGSYDQKKTIKQITLFPIIPTVGLSFKF